MEIYMLSAAETAEWNHADVAVRTDARGRLRAVAIAEKGEHVYIIDTSAIVLDTPKSRKALRGT